MPRKIHPPHPIPSAKEENTAIQTTWLKERRKQHFEEFTRNHDAKLLTANLSADMDAFIAGVCTRREKFCVIACGGYGRGELFPYSDIDLLFLTTHEQGHGEVNTCAEAVLYALWDAGLKTGHATRSIDEAITLAKTDMTVRTAMLDMRLLSGDAVLFAQLNDRLQEEVIAPSQHEFIEAKLLERDARHKRYGDSRNILEPNIKESKGGLRDIHALYWLTRHAYGTDIAGLVEKGLLKQEEYENYRAAYEFLSRMRAALHLAAGKAEEHLTFKMQIMLAHALGFRSREPHKAVERLMKRYFLTAGAVGNFTRIVCALLEDERKRKSSLLSLPWLMQYPWRLHGFTLDNHRLNIWTADDFERDPTRILELFSVAQEHQLDIHPNALWQVARNLGKIDRNFLKDKRANELFLNILLSRQGPEVTLRRMNEIGLLGRFIPDFGRIVGQMQFNMYHTYTVDEHTIRALGILREIERGKRRDQLAIASDMALRIHSRRALYLALFCHDIAKGKGGDHSEAGEAIAIKLARRFHFTAQEEELSGWLVKNHLLMSHTAFKRDLEDPKTIQDFVAMVKTVERLRVLFLLTCADIMAVGPTIWNAWKGTLLNELYNRTYTVMRGGQTEREHNITSLKHNIRAAARRLTLPDITQYIESGSASFLSAWDATYHARMIEHIKAIQTGRKHFSIDIEHDSKNGVSEMRICAPDQPALFSKLAGAFSLSNATIRAAQVFTLKNGMAIDIFQVQDIEGGVFNATPKLKRLNDKLEQALQGNLNFSHELAAKKTPYPTRKDAMPLHGEVFIHNDASDIYTVIEVSARDRPGLLYDITRTLSEAKLTIASAHISTYGEQAVDVFYIKDAFGHKITHEGRMRSICNALQECLGK